MKKLFLAFILLSLCQHGKAQETESLRKLPSPIGQIYFSPGHEQRAEAIANKINSSYAYFEHLLSYKPSVTLMILNESDWNKYSSMQMVYGMPHFNPTDKTLFVAAQDNAFWKSFIPPLDQLPAELAQQISTTYKTADGSLSMQAFFDLLAIHELGHAFSSKKGLKMQRNWMGELFVNILLHTYIAEKEPGLLPALTIFPRMVVASGSSEFKFTSLTEVDKRYDEIARDHPKNYGWYQSRWHAAAANIYDAAGKDVGKKIWNALLTLQESLPDEEFTSFLEIHTHKSLSDLIRNWETNTKK